MLILIPISWSNWSLHLTTSNTAIQSEKLIHKFCISTSSIQNYIILIILRVSFEKASLKRIIFWSRMKRRVILHIILRVIISDSIHVLLLFMTVYIIRRLCSVLLMGTPFIFFWRFKLILLYWINIRRRIFVIYFVITLIWNHILMMFPHKIFSKHCCITTNDV